ncbi:MAG: ABC transporter ATP-binding protein [Magnetovibrio sp.]|nr:ABC transporter ATP-binding protein [Magnetovibrio sp.]
MFTIENLSCHYGRIQALHDVTLNVDKGELVALVGTNGAGKTTLLHTLSGLIKASTGTIKFDGGEITHTTARRRVQHGIIQVPEGRQVFAPMSVEDNLLLGGYTQDTSVTAPILDHVYSLFPVLQDKKMQAAGTLSGGQQQMLAIGRALMSKPKILLLDEPSMGLAPLLVDEVFNTVQRLRDEGVTIFLVEQNAYKALSIADRAYVLEAGKVVLEGTGKDLIHNERVKQAYLGL